MGEVGVVVAVVRSPVAAQLAADRGRRAFDAAAAARRKRAVGRPRPRLRLGNRHPRSTRPTSAAGLAASPRPQLWTQPSGPRASYGTASYRCSPTQECRSSRSPGSSDIPVALRSARPCTANSRGRSARRRDSHGRRVRAPTDNPPADQLSGNLDPPWRRPDSRTLTDTFPGSTLVGYARGLDPVTPHVRRPMTDVSVHSGCHSPRTHHQQRPGRKLV
jgi:hypothetical protein